MPFDLQALNVAVAATEFAGHLHHLTTVESTQTLAHAAARAGGRHGVWIADQQTAGRGRGAHTWHSPAGHDGAPAGLYMSVLATRALPMQSTLRLSFLTAIAVQSAIAELTGLAIPRQIDIRWPNDLVIPHGSVPQSGERPTGTSRKTGGILIELAARPVAPDASPQTQALLKHAVVGVGINLNQLAFPPELDTIATSLRRELPGHPILPREPLAAAILRNLSGQLRSLGDTTGHPTTPNSHLHLHSTWLTGKRVRVEPRPGNASPETQPSYTGTTAGLTPEGFLLVQGDDGQLHTVLSGGLREP